MIASPLEADLYWAKSSPSLEQPYVKTPCLASAEAEPQSEGMEKHRRSTSAALADPQREQQLMLKDGTHIPLAFSSSDSQSMCTVSWAYLERNV